MSRCRAAQHGRIAGTVQAGYNHADPQLLLNAHTRELLLYHRRSGGSPNYVVIRSRLTSPNWTDFQSSEIVLVSAESPGRCSLCPCLCSACVSSHADADSDAGIDSAGPGVRAREPMDAKFLPARNQTIVVSDQFLWPLNGGRMNDVAFLSGKGDGGAHGVLCYADTGKPWGALSVQTELAQVTLLQDATGGIKHIMLARNNKTNQGYGPVVFALKADLNRAVNGLG